MAAAAPAVPAEAPKSRCALRGQQRRLGSQAVPACGVFRKRWRGWWAPCQRACFHPCRQLPNLSRTPLLHCRFSLPTITIQVPSSLKGLAEKTRTALTSSTTYFSEKSKASVQVSVRTGAGGRGGSKRLM